MAQDIKKVIVVGGSGHLGTFIVHELLAAKFQVSALTREGSSAAFPEGVTVHKSDFSQASITAAFRGQDAVVSAITTPAIQAQKAIVDAAVEAGVNRFIPSEFGVNTTKDRTLALVPPLRGKRMIVEYLQSKEGQGNDFSWTSIITGLFIDAAVSGTPNPFLPYNIRERTAVLPTPKDLRDVPFSVASRTQVGRAVASALLPSHLAATKNRYLLIRSFSVSQHDILASFEKATGGGKWTVRDDDVPDTEKHAQAIEKLGKGDFSVFPQLLLSSFYDRDTGIHFDAEPEFANPLLGLPDEDLDSLVGRAVKEAEKPSAL